MLILPHAKLESSAESWYARRFPSKRSSGVITSRVMIMFLADLAIATVSVSTDEERDWQQMNERQGMPAADISEVICD